MMKPSREESWFFRSFNMIEWFGCEAPILCEFDFIEVCIAVAIGSVKLFTYLFLLLVREFSDEVANWNDTIVQMDYKAWNPY